MLGYQIVGTVSIAIVFGFVSFSSYALAGLLAGTWLIGVFFFLGPAGVFALWWLAFLPVVVAVAASWFGVPFLRRQDAEMKASYINPAPPTPQGPGTSVLVVVTPEGATVDDISAQLSVETVESVAAFMGRKPEDLLQTISDISHVDLRAIPGETEAPDEAETRQPPPVIH